MIELLLRDDWSLVGCRMYLRPNTVNLKKRVKLDPPRHGPLRKLKSSIKRRADRIYTPSISGQLHSRLAEILSR